MPTSKALHFSLASSVAIALAAIIYIIVDKTTYCRDGDPKLNTAVSYEDGMVVCLPGYVFTDGNPSHNITCDSPPYWNWNTVPDCIRASEAYAWKCPVQSSEFELVGEILIFQADPLDAVHVQGKLEGLKSSTIQVVNIEDTNKTCHVTNELGLTGSLEIGMIIDGNNLLINETLTNTMMLNETFQFFIRAIGSQHVLQQRKDQFNGVAVFVLEQKEKTIGVFSTNSAS